MISSMSLHRNCRKPLGWSSQSSRPRRALLLPATAAAPLLFLIVINSTLIFGTSSVLAAPATEKLLRPRQVPTTTLKPIEQPPKASVYGSSVGTDRRRAIAYTLVAIAAGMPHPQGPALHTRQRTSKHHCYRHEPPDK